MRGENDENGNTPVLAAAYAGHVKVVCCLVEWGADLDHRNAEGKTARTIMVEVMELLKPN